MAEVMSLTGMTYLPGRMLMVMQPQAPVRTGPPVVQDLQRWVITTGQVAEMTLLHGTLHMVHEVAVLQICRAPMVMGSFTVLLNSIDLQRTNV